MRSPSSGWKGLGRCIVRALFSPFSEKIHSALGEEIFLVVGNRIHQVLERIGGAADPAVPINIPSRPDQTQILLTLWTFHKAFPLRFYSSRQNSGIRRQKGGLLFILHSVYCLLSSPVVVVLKVHAKTVNRHPSKREGAKNFLRGLNDSLCRNDDGWFLHETLFFEKFVQRSFIMVL
jgi:hypothetical protein